MKSFTVYIKNELKTNHRLLLDLLDPVCALISLYNGPQLNEVAMDKNEAGTLTARGLKNEFAFTFLFDSNTSISKFGYYFKGSMLLEMTINSDGAAICQLPTNTSSIAELELRKTLLNHSLSEQEIILSDNPFEFTLTFQPYSISNPIFLETMNEICQEFSFGAAPKFSHAMLNEEFRKLTHERIYRLSATTNNAAIEFEDYTCDSGSHSYPNESRYTFSYQQAGKNLIQINRQGNRLVFQTRFEDHVRFEKQIRQKFALFDL